MSWVASFVLGNIWRTATLALVLGIGLLTLRLDWAQEARDEAIREGAVALSANRTSTAMVTALVAQRDGLLLQRAADERLINEALSETAAYVQALQAKHKQAIAKINELAARPDCYSVMQQAVCPSIADALRAP